MEASKGSRPSPMTLHDIVVDYIVNAGYAGTAKVLATTPPRVPPAEASSSSTPPPEGIEIDMDGDGALGSRSRGREGNGVDTDGADSSGLSVRTAREGKSVSPSPTPRPPTLDEHVLASIDQRRAILDYILSGAIVRAVDALNTHFPTVLTPVASNGAPKTSRPSNGAGSSGSSNGASASTPIVLNPSLARSSKSTTEGTKSPVALDHRVPVFAHSAEPDHVHLNLQIQGFVELYRAMSPSAPPSPSSSMGSLPGSSNSSQLTNALAVLQDLWEEGNRLRPDDRAVYLGEIREASGLLAYTDPETSVVSGFLDQARRVALAQQVNAAILKSEGRPVQSHLEQIVRRTHAIYATLYENNVDPTPSWTGDAKGAMHWRIAEQLKRRPFHKGGFNLREYVWETS